MTLPVRRRGASLTLLVSILGLWIGGRMLIRITPFSPPRLEDKVLTIEADAATMPARKTPVIAIVEAEPKPVIWLRPANRFAPSQTKVAPGLGGGAAEIAPKARIGASGLVFGDQPASARSRQDAMIVPAPFEPGARAKRTVTGRWSADAWSLIRQGGRQGLGAGLTPATYGASQIGAVLRYRLAPGSAHRPAAYLRVSRSLHGPPQREAAVGLSARLVAGLPVSAAGELRIYRDAFGTRLRPAVLAITEMPPLELPQGLRAEAYAQAGYVGGKGATGFVDGQVRLDRSLGQVAHADVRLGVGAWGGAQKGASRLDVGPSAVLAFPLSETVFARAAIDWRFRVAGHAAPVSGPAFTLSAGF